MSFRLLDSFYDKEAFEIDLEYSIIVTKPEFKDGDSDKLLIIILNHFLEHQDEFSNIEIKVIASIVRIRELRAYIEFRKIYQIIKILIEDLSIDTLDNDVNKIKSLFLNNSRNDCNYVDFSYIASGPEIIKNVMTGICCSPGCNNFLERLDDYTVVPVQYGTVEN